MSPYNQIDAVIFDGPGNDETPGYEGPLPEGLTFTDTPHDLVQKLGPPITGKPVPGGSLKWMINDGSAALFVAFLHQPTLKIRSVQLATTT